MVLYDLARDDMPSAIADAYRYDRLVVAAASYDGGIFPCMETFLRKLKAKNFQKRTVGYIQNGTWAPCTAKQMQAIMGELKNITNAEPVVTIKSAMKEADVSSRTYMRLGMRFWSAWLAFDVPYCKSNIKNAPVVLLKSISGAFFFYDIEFQSLLTDRSY